MKVLNFFLSIVNWFKGLFQKTIVRPLPIMDELDLKGKPNPNWKRIIQKVKSKNGALRQKALPLNQRSFRTFGTFSKCKPFTYKHKAI